MWLRLLLGGLVWQVGACGGGTDPAMDPLDAGPPLDAEPGTDAGDDGSAEPDAGQGEPDAGPRVDPASVGGYWVGEAHVEGTSHLATGFFPVRLALIHEAGEVRGVLDVEQNVADGAEAFTYYFEGSVYDGALEGKLTDRFCSNTDVDGLCMPYDNGETYPFMGKVFVVSARVGDDWMQWRFTSVLEDLSYPPGVPAEAPFTLLELDREAPVAARPDPGMAGEWAGPCFAPGALSPRTPYLQGRLDIELAAEGETVELVSIDPPLESVDPASLRVDEDTGRLWFLQPRTEGGHWLYSGAVVDDLLMLAVVDEPMGDPLYDASAAPRGPLGVPFERLVNVCTLAQSP